MGPDPPSGGNATSIGDLAAELRRLLRVAESASGTPVKVNALARKLHISPSSLYAYLDGTTLPPPMVLDQMLHELAVGGSDFGRIVDLRHAAETQRRTRRRLSTSRPTHVPSLVVSPCQLPPDVRGFTGRAEQLSMLDALLIGRADSTAASVAVVCGAPGVGKTALAVHWAYRVRGQFPDGLLHVDLRGFDLEQPLDPSDVLSSFLRSLGIAGDAIPEDLAERATLFRTQLDGRRILVILDNAASEEQVRYLLPNSASCFVVVTSRNNLTGLVARHGAIRIPVSSLPLRDAVMLLRTLVGDQRVDADKPGAAALADRCARLPLAIRIGADLAHSRRRAPLAELAAELHRYHLDLFNAGGDERTAIRTVFSWSYLHLRSDRARAFRLLGLHPGQDADECACAALMGVDLSEASLRIDDLIRANLLEEAGHRRYRMHDLLRAYAREQVTDHGEAVEAHRRLFDHYMSSAAAAMGILAPYDRYHQPTYQPPEMSFPDAKAALEWLDRERQNLLTLTEYAANHGAHNRVVQLSGLLYRFLDTRAHYSDAMALHTLALTVARNSGNPLLEGLELYRIGSIHMRLSHHVEAKGYLTRALVMARRVRDRVLESRSLHCLAQVCFRLGDNVTALEHLELALPMTRDTGNRYLEGHVLITIGWVYRRLGLPEETFAVHRQALELAGEVGNRDLEGHVLNSLGHCYNRFGNDAALSCHERALAIAKAGGDRGLEADALASLGAIHLSKGNLDKAVESLDRALAIAVGVGRRDIEVNARCSLGRLHARSDDYGGALSQLEQAAAIANDIGNRDLEVEVLDCFDESFAKTNPSRAAEYYEQALAIARATEDRWQQARAHEGASQAYYRLGRPQAARNHLVRSQLARSSLGVGRESSGSLSTRRHSYLFPGPEPRHHPPAHAFRWRGYSHAELYRLLHEGVGPMASFEPARRWAELATTLNTMEQDLRLAIERSASSGMTPSSSVEFTDTLVGLHRQIELAEQGLPVTTWAHDPVSAEAMAKYNERSVGATESALAALRAYRDRLIQAALGTCDDLAGLPEWAQQIGRNARKMCTLVESQAELLACARAHIPVPADVFTTQADHTELPAATLLRTQSDGEQAESAALTCADMALEVMARYERDTAANIEAMPSFSTVTGPTVTAPAILTPDWGNSTPVSPPEPRSGASPIRSSCSTASGQWLRVFPDSAAKSTVAAFDAPA